MAPRNPITRTAVVSILLILGLAGSGRAEDSETLLRMGAWPYGPSQAVEVDAARDLVFLGAGGVVLVLDGSDRTAPILITDDLHTQGVVEDLHFDPTRQLLYAACGEGGLEIWDLADPAVPVRLSITEVLYFGYETPVGHVQLYDHFAILECSWGYVHSLDVTDPSSPVQVGFNGQMGNPARAIHVSADGQIHSTGADRYQRLAIFPDGSLHNSAQKDFTYGPYAIFGTEEVAYVGYGGHLYVIDLLHPALPFWSETNMGGVTDLVVADGIGYIINGDGLQIWDMTVHNDPIFLGRWDSSTGPVQLAVAEGYAYVAMGHGGLRVVDLDDLTAPTEVGSYDTFSVTWNTRVDGDHAYVAHASHGLLVLELGDLTRPRVVGQVEMAEEARDLVLVDDRLRRQPRRWIAHHRHLRPRRARASRYAHGIRRMARGGARRHGLRHRVDSERALLASRGGHLGSGRDGGARRPRALRSGLGSLPRSPRVRLRGLPRWRHAVHRRGRSCGAGADRHLRPPRRHRRRLPGRSSPRGLSRQRGRGLLHPRRDRPRHAHLRERVLRRWLRGLRYGDHRG